MKNRIDRARGLRSVRALGTADRVSKQAFAQASELVAEAERLGRWDDGQASSLRLLTTELTARQQISLMERLYPLINSGKIEVTVLGVP